MFATNERALSHGCIHLEHPAEMAQWLLRDKPDWTLERVEHTMQEGLDNNTVYLTKPVPILIVYGTAIVQDDGEVSLLPGRLRPRRISRSSLGQRLPVSIDAIENSWHPEAVKPSLIEPNVSPGTKVGSCFTLCSQRDLGNY